MIVWALGFVIVVIIIVCSILSYKRYDRETAAMFESIYDPSKWEDIE